MGIGEERGNERNEFRFRLSSSLCKKVDDWDVLHLCSLAFFPTPLSLSLSSPSFLPVLYFYRTGAFCVFDLVANTRVDLPPRRIKRQAQDCSGRPQDSLKISCDLMSGLNSIPSRVAVLTEKCMGRLSPSFDLIRT